MTGLRVLYKPDVIARRVRQLGRDISRDFRGKTLDVVGVLDNGYVFVADLVRALDIPVRIHFIRTEMRDIIDPGTGKPRQEIFYSPEIRGEGRRILVVDGVVRTGVTHDFLLRRMGLGQPKEVKLAVLIDKVAERRVLLEPDYIGFKVASNEVVIGYGLSLDGTNGHLPYLAKMTRSGGRGAKTKKRKR